MAKKKAKRRLVLSCDSPDGVLELPDGSCRLLLTHVTAEEVSAATPTASESGDGSGAARKVLDRDKGSIEDAWRQRSGRAEMRELLSERFSREELRTLCFDLGLDYDDLPSRGKASKARDLLDHFWRRHRRGLSGLVGYIERNRPDVFECLPSEVIEMAVQEPSKSSHSPSARKGGRAYQLRIH